MADLAWEFKNGGVVYTDYEYRTVNFRYSGPQIVEWRCKKCRREADVISQIDHEEGCENDGVF